MGRDKRTPDEIAAWEASLFALHTAGEQEVGNPIAPPS